MKILKPGRKQKGWSVEATCTGKGNGGAGCGAVLLVEETDLYRTFSSSHYDVSTEDYITFKCEACGVETNLTGKKRPPHRIESQLKERGDNE